jgi:hypothetical protein
MLQSYRTQNDKSGKTLFASAKPIARAADFDERQIAISGQSLPILNVCGWRAKLLDPLAPKPHQSCARTNEPC